MTKFNAGDKVRVAGDATWGWSKTSETHSEVRGSVAEVAGGPDGDDDYYVVTDGGHGSFVGAAHLTLVGDEEWPVPGGRYVVTSHGRTWVGLPHGTEVTLAGDFEAVVPEHDYDQPYYLFTVEHERASEMTRDDWDGNGTAWLRMDEVEQVEVPDEGDNDDDNPVGEVPMLNLGNLMPNPSADMVNHPPHYGGFSNGAEVIDITENLTFNGGNAVKYVARSTRKDGRNKGDVLEDLKKARWYIDREIERVENQQD